MASWQERYEASKWINIVFWVWLVAEVLLTVLSYAGVVPLADYWAVWFVGNAIVDTVFVVLLAMAGQKGMAVAFALVSVLILMPWPL